MMTIVASVDHEWILLLLLSLNAHNHVDDYSGSLGGVRKVHIYILLDGEVIIPPDI